MTEKKFTLTGDNNNSSELPVHHASIGHDVINISKLASEHGVFTYDIGFGATACCESKITYIDGDKGILQYRGIPIEQLAEKSSFIEVAYLLFFGELPTQSQLSEFEQKVINATECDGKFINFSGFDKNRHPMAMILSSLGSMAAHYNNSFDINDKVSREEFCINMLGKILPIASAAFKHTEEKEFVRSNSKLSYCANLINMFFGNSAHEPIENEIAEKAIDILFILHADHEQNCSTSSVRLSGSSGVNPYAAIASGIAALWGPAHGGANEAVINMLEEIGTTDQILKYIDKAKDKNDPFRLMGFGHRVYKNYDPRATIIRKACHDVLASVGQEDSPLLELAQELEKIALKDEYFKSKNLYPNVDFYSGIIYKALNIPATMFTVMFAVARVAGWVSHWKEMVEDPTSRIGRPRQLYTGLFDQEYKDISDR